MIVLKDFGKALCFTSDEVDDCDINVRFKDNETHYVFLDKESDEECKEFIMKYEIHAFNFKVYVDSIEGWQECKVIDIQNTRMGIDRAIVITSTGTQLNRVVKFVIDEDEIIEDGCIYFYEIEI